MSRGVVRRWVLTGDLVARSAVCVGALGDNPVDLVQARDGRNRPVIPGTSLAGVLRAAMGDVAEHLWGDADNDGDGASWVSVDDAVAPENAVVEIREHVSIDRRHGVAARGHLFTRETLAAGTTFSLRLAVDDATSVASSPARQLIDRAILVLSRGVSVGGGTTKGLGRVVLGKAQLVCQELGTREGIKALLAGKLGTPIKLDGRSEGLGHPPANTLRVTIPFRPRGPLLVQVAVEGEDGCDARALSTAGRPGDDAGSSDGDERRIRLELPGDSIKGTLRSHAERIMRTLAGPEVRAPERFLEQMVADTLGPIGRLFGTATDHRRGGGCQGRKGALTAHTCLTRVSIPDLGQGQDGLWFSTGHHVAIDRWTGGSATGLLFSVSEPYADTAEVWQPMVLDVDLGLLGSATSDLTQAITLLLMVLRDLCEGWIGFGHGTTRGMGAVVVDPNKIMFKVGCAVSPATMGAMEGQGLLRDVDGRGRSLASILDDTDLTDRLLAAWPPTTNVEATGTASEERPQRSQP